MADLEPAATRRRPDGPPAGVLGLISLAFTIASVAAFAAGGAWWNSVLVFAASVPLGIYAATVHARLLRLGIRVPGPYIALVGGVSASILLAASGLIAWAQARSASPLPAPVKELVDGAVFALGGIGFASGLGLLIAGIAVPSVILRLVPAWLGWTGLVLAAIGELSFLAMLWNGFDALLPISRFGGLVWLSAVGFLLPRHRREVPRRASSAQPAPDTLRGIPDQHPTRRAS